MFVGILDRASALTITRTSDAVLYIDSSSSVWCSYSSYQIVNNVAVNYSNLWVKIDSFSGTNLRLGGGDPGSYNLGNLGINQTNTVFFYLQATNTTTVAETHAVKVYRGQPATGTLLTNASFSLVVTSSGQNNSQTITSVAVLPNPATVGSLFTITVKGSTGTIGGANKVNFTPAVYTTWDAASYELVSSLVTVTGGNTGTFSNSLVLTFGSPAATAYSNTYWFRAVGVGFTNSASPLSIQSGGGGNYTHTAPPSVGVIPAVQPATNQTLVSSLVNVTQLYTNQTATFTVRLTNSSTNAISLDSVADTLPAGFSYVAGSSSFNGSPITDPATTGQKLTWSDPYGVPSGVSRDLTFQAIPTVAGYATNQAVAYSQSTLIDTTLITTDNVPATSTVRVLLAPTATNDSGTTLEDAALSVAAPGVLSNDAEPNGFSLTVVSYTQPGHGSVTVNANGGYVYTPAADFNGSDNFTYTLTNGNARAAVATVNLGVTAVNDRPTLTAPGNLTINEDAGLQTVNLAGISAGPADEAGQTLAVTASSSNPAVVSNPTVNYTSPGATGSLQFAPATNANGTAIITVVVTDNGGTANGGVNAVTNTFTVTVNGVNDAPSFTKGGNQTVLEDAGARTVAGWATAISAGPADEAAQSVTFHATNDNPGLFSVQPGISSSGTLSYTAAANANGTATVSLYLQDNGGTANGGSDTSATQTFSITVTPVNDPPTLNTLSNLTINEGAGLQTVNLGGISTGPTNEAGQTLTVIATSGNVGLVPNPTVNYTSPGATGTLQFTPVAAAIGSTTVTIVVTDNGGTANGGVNAVTNTFTVTVNGVTNVWLAGGRLTNQVNNASGPAGTGFEQLNLAGVLTVQATSTNPFTIHLASLSGASPGVSANFVYTNLYSWTIVTTTRGVSGFDPTKFVIDDSHFSNDLAGGVFNVTLSVDSNSVVVGFTPNHAPVANAASYGRAWGTVVRIPITGLITGFTSDADGDGRALTRAGSSTNGASVATNSTYILFAPTNNFAESFPYVVRDTRVYRAGDTVQMATNWLTVTVTNAVGQVQSILNSGSGITLNFAGVPGYAYDVERSTNLVAWTVVLTTNAPAAGTWVYLDGQPPSPQAYYRLKQH
ncbi:MAG: hypothetical protein JWR69_1836 [Pedosphaera sp.]|nr:hypothetical protein [Pedosphaera sp.]